MSAIIVYLLFVFVTVPPTNVLIIYDNKRLTDGSRIEFVARKRYEFVCVVPGIKPAASIRWTLNGMPETGVESVVQVGGNLVNSSSNLTVSIPKAAEVSLNCSATNKQMGPKIPDEVAVIIITVKGIFFSLTSYPHVRDVGLVKQTDQVCSSIAPLMGPFRRLKEC